MELLIFVLVAFLVWNLGALVIVLNRDKWLGHIDFFKERKGVKRKSNPKGRRVIKKPNTKRSKPNTKRPTTKTKKSRVRSRR